MLNQVVIVGRLVKKPEILEKDEKQVCNLTLAVPRSYKNAEGVYETDFVDCVLWNGVAQTTTEYCKQGDLIGIKGRIETNTYENDEGQSIKKTNVIADKVTFLSSAKTKDKEDEIE